MPSPRSCDRNESSPISPVTCLRRTLCAAGPASSATPGASRKTPGGSTPTRSASPPWASWLLSTSPATRCRKRTASSPSRSSPSGAPPPTGATPSCSSATCRPSWSPSAGRTCGCWPQRAPGSTPNGKRKQSTDVTDALDQQGARGVLRAPAETTYAAELAALEAADQGSRPPGWRLTPRAVRTFVAGDPALGVTRKFYGDDAL